MEAENGRCDATAPGRSACRRRVVPSARRTGRHAPDGRACGDGRRVGRFHAAAASSRPPAAPLDTEPALWYHQHGRRRRAADDPRKDT